MNYADIVYNFKRKYKRGFIQTEIDELLSQYPKVNLKKFNDALIGSTYEITDENENLTYLTDVLLAFKCAYENVDLDDNEWD